ncbi:MAG: hypothetical protein CME66_02255 [Halobacteriovoraceae bacterium]|jgi:hypothetical protein|nr:hypothetical protein [Halobacteriovoraceae bacterium]
MKVKKLFLVLVLVGSSIAAKANHEIHKGCQDYSYAFNEMDIWESDQKIHFRLSGSTVFKLAGDWERQTTSLFSIDKSKCRLSEDKQLISCHDITELEVERQQRGQFDSLVLIKGLSLELRFVESMSRSTPSGFELVTKYQVAQTQEYVANRVLFEGDREQGCLQR